MQRRRMSVIFRITDHCNQEADLPETTQLIQETTHRPHVTAFIVTSCQDLGSLIERSLEEMIHGGMISKLNMKSKWAGKTHSADGISESVDIQCLGEAEVCEFEYRAIFIEENWERESIISSACRSRSYLQVPTVCGLQVTVKDDPEIGIVSSANVGIMAVLHGGNELREEVPDERFAHSFAGVIDVLHALLKVTAIAELLCGLVSLVTWANVRGMTYIHADPHDSFCILVAVVDGNDVWVVTDDTVEFTVWKEQ
jgi:hypothetical protein